MENEISVIQNKIVAVRGQQVMIDRDIAELYGVETKRLNEQVKRNAERFPKEFCFQLSDIEVQGLISQTTALPSDNRSRSQIATLNSGKKRGSNIKYMPYAFTEQGVAMLSAVLKSETAVKASIQIMKAFVAMRKFLLANAQVFNRLDSLEMRQVESDKKINELFCRMDKYSIDNTQGIFFQGQIFDAYAKFENFIAQAKKEIVLIDGYVDLSVLERLVTKKEGVSVKVYTSLTEFYRESGSCRITCCRVAVAVQVSLAYRNGILTNLVEFFVCKENIVVGSPVKLRNTITCLKHIHSRSRS